MLPWQQKQWAQVAAAAAGNRLSHALLLTGPEGIGLTEFGLQLAGSLLCLNAGADARQCGACRACILMRAGNHPDILRVIPEEPGKQIRVDEIRALLEFMHLSSHSGRYKVAVIDPADAMNRSAANTLLKILEEPPSASIMVLCCHQPGRLPITIRSRCQQLAFNGDCGADTQQWLAQRLDVDAGTAMMLLQRAGGVPFRAVALAEIDALSKQGALLQDLCQLRQAAANPVTLAQKWEGFGFPEVLAWLQEILRNAVVRKLAPGTAGNLSSENGHLQQIADELDLSQLVASYELALRNYQGATGPFNLNQRGLLEEFIVHWQSTARPSRR
jgi:DNA polymerase-3 subunit delta'